MEGTSTNCRSSRILLFAVDAYGSIPELLTFHRLVELLEVVSYVGGGSTSYLVADVLSDFTILCSTITVSFKVDVDRVFSISPSSYSITPEELYVSHVIIIFIPRDVAHQLLFCIHSRGTCLLY
jgi:hypothetical protein